MYFPPVGILCSVTVTIKINRGKNIILCPLLRAFFSKFPIILLNIVWFDFPLAIFPPYYTVSESRTIIACSNGEKIKTQGEKISYIFPQWIFVLLLCSIKIIGEKIWYYVPYCLHFFSKFPIILWNIVLALSFCHLSFLFPCPFYFFLLICPRARCFHDIFSPSGHIYSPPPPGGGYFPIYRPLVLPEEKAADSCLPDIYPCQV